MPHRQGTGCVSMAVPSAPADRLPEETSAHRARRLLTSIAHALCVQVVMRSKPCASAIHNLPELYRRG